jgi:hypothetical protein
MVLAKYIPEDNTHIQGKVSKLIKERDKDQNLIFSRVISFSNIVDPTRYFEVSAALINNIQQSFRGKDR